MSPETTNHGPAASNQPICGANRTAWAVGLTELGLPADRMLCALASRPTQLFVLVIQAQAAVQSLAYFAGGVLLTGFFGCH